MGIITYSTATEPRMHRHMVTNESVSVLVRSVAATRSYQSAVVDLEAFLLLFRAIRGLSFAWR